MARLITRADIPLSAQKKDPVGSMLRSVLAGQQIGNVLAQPFKQQQEQEQQAQTNALAKVALGVDQSSPEQQRNALAQIASVDPQRAQQLLSFQQNVFNTLNAADEQSKRSMVTGALEASLSSDPVSVLRRRSETLRAAGRDTSDTDAIIARFESGDVQGAKDALTSAVAFGQGAGILKTPGRGEMTAKMKEAQAMGLKPGTLEYAQFIMGTIVRPEDDRRLSIAERQQKLREDQFEAEKELKEIDLERKKQKTASETQSQLETANNDLEFAKLGIDRVSSLLSEDGLKGVRKAFGIDNIESLLPGSSAADARAEVDSIVAQLTKENLDLMKGVLTDKDIAMLTSIGTKLQNPRISDDSAIKELKRVLNVFERSESKARKTIERLGGNDESIKTEGPKDSRLRTIGRFQVEVE